jgi:glycosyltransferase EpsE
MKNTNRPLVSVVMPVYNADAYLTRAIDSILRQTYENLELIIVDDASIDGSVGIIERYKRLYPKKISFVRLSKNLNRGGDSCANVGISSAKGKYIARMDADDVSHPKRIEKQVRFLERHSSIFLVGSNAHIINKEEEVIGVKSEPNSHAEILKGYFTFHPVVHSSCMYRRFLKNGKIFIYDKKYKCNNDYYTFFKLIVDGYSFHNLSEKLIRYRIHDKSVTFSNIRKNFIQTFKIRMEMVFKHGFRPTLSGIFITSLQIGVVSLLPEKILLKLYLLTKGIAKIHLRTPSVTTTGLNINFKPSISY